MTQFEIFKMTVNHRPHNTFLYHAGFTPDLKKRIIEKFNIDEGKISDFFGFFSPISIQPEEEKREVDFSKYYVDIDKPEGSFINSLGVLEIPAKYYHFTGYISPLRNAKSLKDIEEFPFPESEKLNPIGMIEKVEKAHKEGKVTVCWVGHMYENSWQIRGYEEFLVDMIENPSWCEYILDRFTDRNIKIAQFAAEAGVDMITTGDDVANQKNLMFSKEMWRKFIKSRWKKVYEKAKSIKPDIQIWYHSDGNIEEIIGELIDIGVTILNPLQPECMDIYKIKREFGKYIVFDGTIGTQSTMPFGTPDEVKRVVRDRKEKIGYDGALILSPTHVLEPDVPIENIEAFVEECRKGY
ncbi:MAG TPA: uroporphyrinogen decarboxylase family protein [bacterium]|nr:uroporphyrinogen decarboxylase family protein [bacterium]HOM25911.1 uroporphyrinogen decarboxylase family protein [bacterium]